MFEIFDNLINKEKKELLKNEKFRLKSKRPFVEIKMKDIGITYYFVYMVMTSIILENKLK